ncbi:MAG: fibronectin type III domain-containing protein [Eubacterium sp.]|nr:fibronectin type III domain-containing protein [Eubacterium sp.]
MQYKKFKRVLACMMAAAMVLTAAPVTALNGNVVMAEDTATVYTGVTKISNLLTTENPANAADSTDTVNGVDYYGATLTIGGTETTVGTEGETLITIVNSSGKEVAPTEGMTGSYTVYVTEYLSSDAIGSWSGLTKFGYRAAAVFKDGAEVVASSAEKALGSATISGSTIKNAVVNAVTSGFSAAINLGGGDLTLENATITMNSDSDGQDVNDFAGYGAAVATYGTGADDTTTVTTIEDSSIVTTGVAKLATFVDNGANLIVKDSTLKSNGGTIYSNYKSTANQSLMINPPWVLGITGSVRTTNVMGENTAALYQDSTIESANWGAISSDSGSYMNILALNDTVKVDGSGYGAYVIGDTTVEDYVGTSFDVQTYAIIMTGGTANLRSSVKGQTYTLKDLKTGTETVATTTASKSANSSVVSENFGFMFHANGTSNLNELNIESGTTIDTGKATLLYKKVNNTTNIDDATITSDNDVLLQIIDNDDDAVGAFMDEVFGMPTFNYSFTESDGWSNTWGQTYVATVNMWGEMGPENYTDALNITNSTITGDVFNASGYSSANPGAILTVTLGEGANLTSAITEAAYQHTYKTFTYYDESNGFDYDTAAAAATKLGDVQNLPAANSASTTNVVLTDDAVWTLKSTSSSAVYASDGGSTVADAATYNEFYIDSLSISDSAKVVIPAGITLHVGSLTYGSSSEDVTLDASTVTSIGTVKTIKAAAKSKKRATVKWSSVANATFYQVQYSTSSKFTKKTTKTVNVTSGRSTTLKKLTAGKKYYVRVRAIYKSDSGKLIGSWSSTVKKFTAKK